MFHDYKLILIVTLPLLCFPPNYMRPYTTIFSLWHNRRQMIRFTFSLFSEQSDFYFWSQLIMIHIFNFITQQKYSKFNLMCMLFIFQIYINIIMTQERHLHFLLFPSDLTNLLIWRTSTQLLIFLLVLYIGALVSNVLLSLSSYIYTFLFSIKRQKHEN